MTTSPSLAARRPAAPRKRSSLLLLVVLGLGAGAASGQAGVGRPGADSPGSGAPGPGPAGPGPGSGPAGAVAPAPDTGAEPWFRTAPYVGLTDNHSEVVNFHPDPFRPVVLDPADRVWAVNPYASTLLRFQPGAVEADVRISTGLSPVSVALFAPTADSTDWRLLVACSGTHALFVHRVSNGEIEKIVPLDSEPADVVVDDFRSLAFVSCRGSNTVVRVNLDNLRVTGRLELPQGQRPGPLLLDRGVPADPQDDRVYVAATVTGNNTTFFRDPGADVGVVRSLDGFPGGELPDHDVFRFAPDASEMEPAVRGAGSLLFDLERNPVTGDLWILSTNSLNDDPDKQDEPALNGDFVVNEARLVPDVRADTPLVEAPPGVDLDDVDPILTGPQYDASRSVNQGRSLAFSADGSAYVASPLSSTIARLDVNGGRIGELQLPEGAQCYALHLVPGLPELLLAHCLGTMSIEVFVLGGAGTEPAASMDLGLDPTPSAIRRGRDLFLDGRRSLDGRSSCNACHPQGLTDHLGWSLADAPNDVKDVMVTQSLLSIGDTFPYHWRGERDLQDFQKAWKGLLGASEAQEPDAAEMADLTAFVESLQAPANPVQNPRRILDDSRTAEPIQGFVGLAVEGQQVFQTVPNADQRTCVECHPFGMGTNGNLFTEGSGLAPRAINQEAAHLRQLQNKGTRSVWVDKDLDGDRGAAGSVEELYELTATDGFGYTHNGNPATLFEFIQEFGQLTTKEQAHVTRFVEQWDQGISPAAHWARKLDSTSSPLVVDEVEEVLIQGALAGWNDVVAFGSLDLGEGPVEVRSFFDVDLERFVPDVQGFPAVTWPQMRAAIQAGQASQVLLGLPLGNGERFGIDHDRDGLRNGQELDLGLDPWDADFDDDGWPDGHELLNGGDPGDPLVGSSDTTPPALVDVDLDVLSARSAKFHLAFSEDVTYRIDYGAPGGPQRTFTRGFFSRLDTANLHHNEPAWGGAPEFQCSITLFDRAGNATGPLPLPSFVPLETQLSVNFPPPLHVESMEVLAAEETVPGTLRLEVRTAIATHLGAPDFLPPEPMMVFFGVAVEDPATGLFSKPDTFTTALPTGFSTWDAESQAIAPYEADPGGLFVVSPLTDAAGETTIELAQGGLQPGQRVRVTAFGIVRPVPGLPGVYDERSLSQMQPLLLEDVGTVTATF